MKSVYLLDRSAAKLLFEALLTTRAYKVSAVLLRAAFIKNIGRHRFKFKCSLKNIANAYRSMPDPNAKRLLWFLFAGSRGGEKRIKIIDLLKEKPYNMNQLAEVLGIDYKAVQHHINVLEKNNMVTRAGEKYGILYFISNYLEVNIDAFNEVRTSIEKHSWKRSGKK